MKYKNVVGILILLIVISVLFIIFKPDRWKKYYQEKLSQPPRQFVIDALAQIPKTQEQQIALDLGSGIGHETLLLLKNGFRVIAIDSQESAFKIMLERPDFKNYKPYLTTIIKSFEKLDFAAIPPLDAIIASFSLPFVRPEHFDFVFSKAIDKLKPGGYFIGNFFDPGFDVFKQSDRKNMTFHTKDQVVDLFKNFKIISFKEIKTPAKEAGKTDHTYEVFARKM